MAVENLKDDQLKALQNAKGYTQACSLIDMIENEGFEAYLVGGCVRDALLGRSLTDFDMCTSARPSDMKRIFKDFKLLLHGEDFGTVSVVIEGQPFEITSFRGDGIYSDSRRPDSVEFKSSLVEDLKRRDFTVNALAFHPSKGVLDFVGGLEDVEAKILRTVGYPQKRFEEDALRIARLVRFSIQLGFEIDDASLVAAKSSAGSLKLISKERVFSEFTKMFKKGSHLDVVDSLFGTKIYSVVNKNVPLSLFEKVYVALKISEALGVLSEDYILEKNMKAAVLTLQKLFKSQTLREDFIRACDKFSLFGGEQLTLWNLVVAEREAVENLKVKPYSKDEISLLTLTLRQQYQGAELGEKIFSSKLEKFFVI